MHTYAAAGTYTVTFTASNGDCSNTFEQTVTVGTIGTHNPNDAFAIHVFPNPADQRIQVEIFEALTGRVNLQITDAMGRVVYEDRFAPASTQMTVDAADFAAGVYTVRVSGNEGSAVRKVTIMR